PHAPRDKLNEAILLIALVNEVPWLTQPHRGRKNPGTADFADSRRLLLICASVPAWLLAVKAWGLSPGLAKN
ncbi:MAG: hypothetical protein WD397_10625, partial [Wenzhouxiangellaceae bacterium]